MRTLKRPLAITLNLIEWAFYLTCPICFLVWGIPDMPWEVRWEDVRDAFCGIW